MSFGPHNPNGQKRRPGQPLLVFGVLLLGWAGMRFALWTEPYAMPLSQAAFAESGTRVNADNADNALTADGAPDRPLPDANLRVGAPVQAAAAPLGAPLSPAPDRLPLPEVPSMDMPRESADFPALETVPAMETMMAPLPVEPAPAAIPAEAVPARVIIGHNLMLVAGLSQVELPPLLSAYFEKAAQSDRPELAQSQPQAAQAVPPIAPALGPIASQSRWSADAWLLLRRDTTTPVLSGRPSYGRSQAGAVLRYRLAPNSPQRPQAYVRASSALEGAKDNEISAGISARPLAKIPLRVAAELRASKTMGGSEIRPAIFAVSEFPPLDLPLGARAEAYLQAGYVGGDNATGFADGQMRVAKPLVKIGPAEFEAGGGVWGGAQKDGERIDIGPSAALTFDLGKARSRLAVDYRFRVAGEAEPSSGPALTLSAGF